MKLIEAVLDLPIEHGERLVALPFLQRLADAHDRHQAGADGGRRFAIDDRVGLAEQPPPFGVADDDVFGARFLQHHAATLRR